MTELVLIFLASFSGAWIGAAFGGSLIILSPLLIFLGYTPAAIIASTRLPLVLQSLIGLRALGVSELNKSSTLWFVGIAAVSSAIAFLLLSSLADYQVAVFLFLLLALVCFSAFFSRSIKRTTLATRSYDSGANEKTLVPSCLFSSSFAGLTGTGAGLIFSFLSIVLYKFDHIKVARIEKVVTVSQAVSVLSLALVVGIEISGKILIPCLLGNALGSYFGIRQVFLLPVRVIQLMLLALVLVVIWLRFVAV